MNQNNTVWTIVLGVCLICLIACGGPDPGPTSGGGSGGGGSSGCTFGCDRGFLCQGQSCVVDATGRWILHVTSGTVSARNANGSAWDGDGSAPDPKVCLTINSIRTCTQTIQDTYAPVWDADFPAATATVLESGVIIEYIDTDFAFDDSICSGTLPVSTSNFASGMWGFTCQGGLGQVTAQLIAQ